MILASAFLALLATAADMIRDTTGLSANPMYVAHWLAYWAAFWLVMRLARAGLDWLAGGVAHGDADENAQPQPTPSPLLPADYRPRSLAPFAAVLIACWSPWLILLYPGVIWYDSRQQLLQFFGQPNVFTGGGLSDHHPVFDTMLYGSFVRFGQLIGSADAGAWLFTVVQSTATAFALATTVALARRCGASRRCALAMLAFLAFWPQVPVYASAMAKDATFLPFLLAFSVMAVEAMRTRGAAFARPRFALGFFAAAALMCLTRKTGIIVMLAIAVAVFASIRGPRPRGLRSHGPRPHGPRARGPRDYGPRGREARIVDDAGANGSHPRRFGTHDAAAHGMVIDDDHRQHDGSTTHDAAAGDHDHAGENTVDDAIGAGAPPRDANHAARSGDYTVQDMNHVIQSADRADRACRAYRADLAYRTDRASRADRIRLKARMMVAGTMAACALLMGVVMPAVVMPALGAIPGGRQEALGLMFQQSSRLLRDHGDEVPAWQREAIVAALGDDVESRYSWWVTDTVKDPTIEDPAALDRAMPAYLRAWAAGLVEHPGSYAQTYLAVEVGWFAVPQIADGNTIMYLTPIDGHETDHTFDGSLALGFRWSNTVVGDALEAAVSWFQGTPLGMVVGAKAFWSTWALVFLIAECRRRAPSRLAWLAPLVAVNLVLWVSPTSVTFEAMRYLLPTFFLVPLSVALVAGVGAGTGAEAGSGERGVTTHTADAGLAAD